MNRLGAAGTPFFFLLDFSLTSGMALPLSEIDDAEIRYMLPGKTNASRPPADPPPFFLKKDPPSFADYRLKFDRVRAAIQAGDTYLLNLTAETPVETNYTLEELFRYGKAKYKLWLRDRFVHFSPEPFVKIRDGRIFSCPMKGTIDAGQPDAMEKILADPKEEAEQYIIVDLIRNDLSRVAREVRVEDFRYVERVQTHRQELLQVSSRIGGRLMESYARAFGDLFAALLPAGSVSGAPKPRTLELIRSIEGYDRGFYTGVWGIYDGAGLDSCVIIRYLEQTPAGLVFRSGGGITSGSVAEKEFLELTDKIYVPVY
ncbi:aminodeoxychorismate synthase component I [Compostibacter hankyongensis]|uniref:Aminodeoxychorismate synthase component I n=2 Tax=Compostibacter hankyongensis TaxID=1007089 RepID=A0ABP8FHI9_9BACT